jgi:hypothetical protein
VLNTLGFALLGSDAAAEARGRFARALRFARDGGYQYLEAQAGIGDAEALLVIGEPGQARAAAAAALVVARGRYRILQGDALVLLARAADALGDEKAVARHSAEARAVYESEGAYAKLPAVDVLSR